MTTTAAKPKKADFVAAEEGPRSPWQRGRMYGVSPLGVVITGANVPDMKLLGVTSMAIVTERLDSRDQEEIVTS